MSISDEVKKRGFQLLNDPRVTKLLQSEQFVRAMMAVVQMPGKVNEFTQEQSSRFASMLQLVSDERFQRLQRRVEALESEVDALRKRREQ